MHTDESRAALSIERLSKGAFVGYMLYGNDVELIFTSPTGDDSDSQSFVMRCSSPEQAYEVARMHMRVWDLASF